MQISARSYLTAGMSLTTAAAIALTPVVVVPTTDRAVSIPNVTVSDIQLTVTPSEVVEFFDTLRTRVDEFNASVAAAAAVPGQTIADGIRSAMELNDQFFESLAGSVSNPTLQLLLETLAITNDRALRSLAFYVEDSNQTLVVAGRDIADLLTGIVTVSLSNILASTVDALNNPLSFEKYAHVLAATVGSGFLVVNGSGQIVQKAGNAGFDLTYGSLELVRSEVTTALDAVRRLAFVASGATGSDLVQAVVTAMGTITLAPAYLGLRIPVSVAEETLLSSQSAFNSVFNAISGYRDAEGQYVPGVVTAMGEAVREAIDEIGHGPLDPQRYLTATALMIAGSFDATNIAINTAGALAQVPFQLGINLIAPDAQRSNLTWIVTAENIQVANSLTNVLRALGLPDDVAELPLTVAEQVNDTITGTAYTVADGLANVNAAITGGTDLIIEVSNTIENAILGALSAEDPTGESPEPGGDDGYYDHEFPVRPQALDEETSTDSAEFVEVTPAADDAEETVEDEVVEDEVVKEVVEEEDVDSKDVDSKDEDTIDEDGVDDVVVDEDTAEKEADDSASEDSTDDSESDDNASEDSADSESDDNDSDDSADTPSSSGSDSASDSGNDTAAA